MIKRVTAVTFRRNLGEMLNQVQFRRDSIVITKFGEPVAALIDVGLFERIRRFQDRFDQLANRLAGAFANVPEADGVAEIRRATSSVRGKKS